MIIGIIYLDFANKHEYEKLFRAENPPQTLDEFKAERDREVEKEPAAENPNDFNDKKKEDLVGFQGSYQKFLHSRDAKIPVLEISLGPLRS